MATILWWLIDPYQTHSSSLHLPSCGGPIYSVFRPYLLDIAAASHCCTPCSAWHPDKRISPYLFWQCSHTNAGMRSLRMLCPPAGRPRSHGQRGCSTMSETRKSPKPSEPFCSEFELLARLAFGECMLELRFEASLLPPRRPSRPDSPCDNGALLD
jgi:hypothetical protein